LSFIKTGQSDTVIKSLVETIQRLISSCFIIYWHFGHFQRLFSPELWNCTRSKTTKNCAQKCDVYLSYTFFAFVNIFFTLSSIKSLIDYYIPSMFSVRIIPPEVYNVFGQGTGPIDICISLYLTCIWMLVLFFYMTVLNLINERLVQFVKDLEEVSFCDICKK
jgi:hypothetical protein